MSKKRLDVLMVERGLVESREKAQALIRTGQVLVDGQVVIKPSARFGVDVSIEVKQPLKYVSRGGYKLEWALDNFGVDVSGFVCLDVGASTGGFTDCLLQRGAERVYAVDVGRGQLDWKLRNDPRVVVLEKVHAARMTREHVPEDVDLITIDVSFISLRKILDNVVRFKKPDGRIIALIKPQFEVHPRYVGKGGVVRSREAKRWAIERVVEKFRELGLPVSGIIKSRPRGPKGNEEFFIYSSPGHELKDIESAIEEALDMEV